MHHTFLTLLPELTTYANQEDQSNPEVSKASVYRHIDHIYRSTVNMVDSLEHSDPTQYQRSFNPIKHLVLRIGALPRGKAQTPSHLLHTETIDSSSLEQRQHKARNAYKQIDWFDTHAHFTAEKFASFNRDQTKRFVDIHAYHHIKIIRDILH